MSTTISAHLDPECKGDFQRSLEYYRARYELIEGGIRYGGISGRKGELLWADITKARCSLLMQWFRLESQSGEVVRLSTMLIGLEEFAREVLRNVEPDAIDSRTRTILEATARGRPPRVW